MLEAWQSKIINNAHEMSQSIQLKMTYRFYGELHITIKRH